MAGAGVGEVVRVGRRRGHGVQRRPTYDPVVTVIDVVLPEIDGRRIRGDHRVRANLSHQGDQPGPQGPIIVELPVAEAQPVMRLDAQDGARGRHLLAAASHQFDRGRSPDPDDPLSPSAQMQTWTAAPAAAQRARVPPADTSGSSGWA